ncbi:MAG: hypothetical protein GF364_11485 [Candidatus Lokiarchaeota archaeon]|nr:hypothetical protein [Candidatus Lokiarchaeota archaeon]
MLSDKVVKNSLVNALLEAIFDVLDADGRKSIIQFANVDITNEKLPSKGTTSFDDFIKLVNAMNFLLAYSKTVMYEIGRKFSFYFSPYGGTLSDFIDLIQNTLSNEMKTEISYPKDNMILIKIKNCPFCKGAVTILPGRKTEGFTCEFFKGLIYGTMAKSSDLGDSIEVSHICKGLNECIFEVEIQKKEKE